MSIRTTWLQGLVATCQVFIGDTVNITDDNFVQKVGELDRRLPPGQSALESIVRRALLTEVCVRALGESDLRVLRRALLACGIVPIAVTPAVPPTQDSLRAEAVRLLADDQYAEPITLESLSRRFHLHRNALARSFRLTYGVPFHNYLVERRVLKASELLLKTPYKVEAIAAMVGYRSKKNFYIEFRRVMGATPAAFRTSSPSRSWARKDKSELVSA